MNATKTEANKTNQQAPAEARKERPAVRPRVDIFENDAEFLVVTDVPGVAKDALEVRFEEGELRLEARRAPSPQADAQRLAEEYRVVDYRRAFAMPEGVDAERIEAELSNGVLTLHLPKAAAKRPRRIDIRAS